MSKLDKIESLQRLIKQDSANFQARRELAVLLIDSGFNEEALQHLTYLSWNFENDEGIFYNLGIVYEKMKSLKKAKESYSKAIEINPEYSDAIYNLGLVLTELKEYENAINCFNKIIEEDPEDSNTYFNLGLAYFKQKDYINAIENFQSTIDINDEDLYAHFYLGNIFKELGDIDSAIEQFEKVIEIAPNYSWAYFNLAAIYNEQGNIDATIENLKMTIEMNPLDVEAYKLLTKLLIKKQSFKESVNVINTAISQCEETGDLDYLASLAYRSAGDTEKGIQYLERAIRLYQTLSIPVQTAKEELSKLK